MSQEVESLSRTAGRLLSAVLDQAWPTAWGLISAADRAAYRNLNPMTIRVFRQVRSGLLEITAGQEFLLRFVAESWLKTADESEAEADTAAGAAALRTVSAEATVDADGQVGRFRVSIPLQRDGEGWRVALGVLADELRQVTERCNT